MHCAQIIIAIFSETRKSSIQWNKNCKCWKENKKCTYTSISSKYLSNVSKIVSIDFLCICHKGFFTCLIIFYWKLIILDVETLDSGVQPNRIYRFSLFICLYFYLLTWTNPLEFPYSAVCSKWSLFSVCLFVYFYC